MHKEEQYTALRERLVIDPLRLDTNLIQLGPDMQEAAEASAEAMQIRDMLAHEFDVQKVHAARRIRTMYERKPAEALIEKEVLLDDDVVKALYAFLDAKREAAMWQALFEGFKDKGPTLRRMADMAVAGFVAPSSVYAQGREVLRQGRSQQ